MTEWEHKVWNECLAHEWKWCYGIGVRLSWNPSDPNVKVADIMKDRWEASNDEERRAYIQEAIINAR